MPWAYVCSKVLFCWAYFRGSLFSEGLIIGGNFAFQNGLDVTIKTASTNSPWACIREGLLSEGYLRLRFGGGGLIFGRAYYYFFFGGGEGGAYYRNFTVHCISLNKGPGGRIQRRALNPEGGGGTLISFLSTRCNFIWLNFHMENKSATISI